MKKRYKGERIKHKIDKIDDKKSKIHTPAIELHGDAEKQGIYAFVTDRQSEL